MGIILTPSRNFLSLFQLKKKDGILNLRGLSEKYRTYLYISALALFFIILETAKSHRGLCRDYTEVVEAMRYCVYSETAYKIR